MQQFNCFFSTGDKPCPMTGASASATTTTTSKFCSNIENINDYFVLPISYNNDKTELDTHIITDLELVKCVDTDSTPIYNYVFNPSNCFGKKMMEKTPNLFTTDKVYLKDTQHILQTFDKDVLSFSKTAFEPTDTSFKEIIDIYDEIKNDISFKDKYYYLDWEHLWFLNKCDWFMQLMSMYNLASPVLSLFLPIIMLIIPFFVIKAKGLELTVDEYLDILKTIIANHAIGKIFTKFGDADPQQKLYLIVSAAFYVFSIYQNVLVCIKFHKNMKKIYSSLHAISKYLSYTTERMQKFNAMYSGLPSYKQFNENMGSPLLKLEAINAKLSNIDNLDEFNISYECLKQIGYVMTEFYEIYDNEDSHSAIMYSFGFHGYMDNIRGLQENITNGHLNYCSFHDASEPATEPEPDTNDKPSFSKEDKKALKKALKLKKKALKKALKGEKKEEKKEDNNKSTFKSAYYPALIGQKSVKNSYNLNKHLIITGPNASGKTTLLKTTLINLILSQQFGCGCYEEANVAPYKHIHCYLNIPDTIGRDSLLQAEARRCKDIIDAINKYDSKETHFCVFDELYSGTNPEEAIISAYVVMDYLAKHKNVSTILTTHYVELCKKLEKNKQIKNCHMKVNVNALQNNFEYTYLLENGISDVKGGIKVLIDMNYPQEIIDNAKDNKFVQ